jgi:DNA-binding transcriptional MerR regulator
MARADEPLGVASERRSGDAALTATLTISRAARAVALSRTTLLYYEKLGLVRPLRQGSSRYRHFRPKDLQTLLAIARWRAAGVPLASVR